MLSAYSVAKAQCPLILDEVYRLSSILVRVHGFRVLRRAQTINAKPVEAGGPVRCGGCAGKQLVTAIGISRNHRIVCVISPLID